MGDLSGDSRLADGEGAKRPHLWVEDQTLYIHTLYICMYIHTYICMYVYIIEFVGSKLFIGNVWDGQPLAWDSP